MHRFGHVFRGMVLAHLAAACTKAPPTQTPATGNVPEGLSIPVAPSATAMTAPSQSRAVTLVRVDGDTPDKFTVQVKNGSAPWNGDLGPLLKEYVGVAHYEYNERGLGPCSSWLNRVCAAATNPNQCTADATKGKAGPCSPSHYPIEIVVAGDRLLSMSATYRASDGRALVQELFPSFRQWEHAWIATQLMYGSDVSKSLELQSLGDHYLVTGTLMSRSPSSRSLWRIHIDFYDDGRVVDATTNGSIGIMRGRRPSGLREPKEHDVSTLGGFFARAAHAEAASITAFARLARELESFGAPMSLVRRARSAARDEVRHAKAMGMLASRFGGEALPVRVSRERPRSFFAFAKENALEGCIAETYAAIEAHYVAESARDEGVRRAHGRIAVDETKHAELAWDVAAWAQTKLTSAEQRRIERAQRTALARLLRDLEAAPNSESLVREAGLPRAHVAKALCDEFFSGRIAA